MCLTKVHSIYRILPSPRTDEEHMVTCQIAVGLQKKLKAVFPDTLVMVRLPGEHTQQNEVGYQVKGENLSREEKADFLKELEKIEKQYFSTGEWVDEDPTECWQYLKKYLDRQEQ